MPAQRGELRGSGDAEKLADRSACRLLDQNGMPAPAAPRTIEETGVSRSLLSDLALKTAYRYATVTTCQVATQMRLPVLLVEELLMEMAQSRLLEVLGGESHLNHRYGLLNRGHERVIHLHEVSRYAGPAPVALDAYSEMMSRQMCDFSPVSLEDVRRALSDLVLPEENIMVAALAVASGRSLFLWGPSGNGKTSTAVALHRALQGEFWIPHCVDVLGEVIQLYDPQVHQAVDVAPQLQRAVDERWVRIRRPLAVAGGEMTLDSLELSYSRTLGLYEFPLHVKVNGGMFVIDDFGRQRAEPWALLNRWIIPMEYGFDYLTLQSGRKITVPFEQLLIVATNIDPDKVMDSAFLRRLGYRVQILNPDEERYSRILQTYAGHLSLAVAPDILPHLFERYRAESRHLRACDPRDLINRVADICTLRSQPLQLTIALLDVAWDGYFGVSASGGVS